MGWYLGIDFWSIWMILGAKLGSKIDQKPIRKGIEKSMKNEAQLDAQKVATRRLIYLCHVGSGILGRITGRGEPLSRGLKPEGLKRRGVENRNTMSNYPSPEGWWDYAL